MSQKVDKPLFTDDELAGGDEDSPTIDSDNDTDADQDGGEITTDNSSSDESSLNNIDESKMQALADQLASLDDNAMAALARGMPDESRQGLLAATAGTLSDEQLAQCGLSKATNMGGDMDGDGDSDDESQLQTDMANARPEQTPGGTFMSLTTSAGTPAKPGKPDKYALELAQMKGNQLLERAKKVHAANPNVITTEQIEGIEANLQGTKCMSLLEPDFGTLQPITTLVAMGERMVRGESNADLLTTKTLNMSLTGDDSECEGGTTPKAVKKPASGSFDEQEAEKAADERWSKSKTKPAITD